MNTETAEKVKYKIKDIINKRGITVYQLSNMADVSGPCIRNWYSKRDYIPSLESLAKVCDALGVSLAELFLEEKEKFYPVSDTQLEMLRKLQSLTPAQRKAVQVHIDSYNK